MRIGIAACLCGLLTSGVWAEGPVTVGSLLKEMVDREAIARFPSPAYTCKQFSSYDRKSKAAEDQAAWFANGDTGQYLRVEEVAAADGKKRKEWVMADVDGPGAVVRIWSANPKGVMRVYLDGAATPAIEAPMTEALGGKWTIGDVVVGKPLSEESSRGWNLYAPIPYAKHCKITCDSDGFYYQVNYRTYEPGARVESLSTERFAAAKTTLDEVQAKLLNPGFLKEDSGNAMYITVPAGGTGTIVEFTNGPGAIASLIVRLKAKDLAAALRSTILAAEFDGQQTVWCPIGDFFGQASGPSDLQDWYRRSKGGFMQTLWVMPYQKSAKITLINLATEPVEFARTCLNMRGPEFWGKDAMHFHAAWRAEYPIHAYGGKGTKDWNYLEATGKGVFVGDSLAVMNPVAEWWGEGDEKIYVDGETFPSHFGTGTEDYYGYAWCWNVPFQHPFHSQPRCDGQKYGNNWGHTTVSRVRSLDAIPFSKSFKFDMEIWHWKECDEAYAATTFFYAVPGVSTNRKPAPEQAAKPIPQPPPLPPPFKIEVAGATTLECEGLKVLAKSEGLPVVPQEMRTFGDRMWSGESQLWVQGRKVGDFVELEIPVEAAGGKPVKLSLHATQSWDYGVVRLSVNGQKVLDSDLFSGQHGKALHTEAIALGSFQPVNGKLVLRAEVVGGNEKSEGTKSFFGLDCLLVESPK